MHATLIERSALRYTPVGLPVVEVQMQHRSETSEAGLPRRLDFAFAAIALGEPARRLADENLGTALELQGFLAPRSRRSTRMLVHVVDFSRLEAPQGPGSGGNRATGI